MYRKDFAEKTVESLSPARYERLRYLINDDRYILFDYLEPEDITRQVFKEKVADYFEKVEIAAGGKKFNFLIEQYANDLDEIVKDHIDKKSYASANGRKSETRAKRYYDTAIKMKKDGPETFDQILDYTRIMLCLYMAVIDKDFKDIKDFDYSSKNLDGKRIIASMKSEKDANILGKKSKKFDTRGKYSIDRCTFIILTIMYQYIKSREEEAES